MANISISQMNTRAEANLSDLHEVAYADSNSQTGYASGKMTMEVMANAIVNDFAYQSLGNKTVKGAIEDAEVTVDTALDPTSTNAVQNRAIAHELAGGNTQASGDVVTIEDGSNLALTSATSTLAPIQDLHGFNYPWVGGAGKNICEVTLTTGGRYEVSNEGKIKCVQTVSSGVSLVIGTVNLIAGNEYILTGGANSSFRLYISVDGTVYTSGTTQSHPFIPTTSDTYNVILAQETSAVVGDVVSPMIRLSTVTDATFAPYSNICPISGYDSAKYTRTGVNVWDEVTELGSIDVDGSLIPSTGALRCKNPIRVNQNTTYHLHIGSTATVGYNIMAYDIKGNFITRIVNDNVSDIDFTTPTNTVYIRFNLSSAYGTTYNNDISINYPSTITTYQPYQGQAVTLTFDNTIYSGVIDWCNGVVTVDKASDTINNLSANIRTDVVNDIRRFQLLVSDMVITDVRGLAGLQSDSYVTISDKRPFSETPPYCIYNGVDGIIPIVVIQDQRYSTIQEFLTAQGTSRILYPLATPTTIQLTPTQLKTLAGYNTIYTDVGNISIAYQPNNVIAECKEYTDNAIPTIDSALDDTSLNPIANKPVAEAIADIVGDISDIDSNIEGSKQLTTTGNVITVSDSAATYLEELEVEVEPIQDLHGYDYPWVGGAGKNLLNVNINSQTVNDVVFTVNADGSVTADGTASGNIVLVIHANLSLPNGTYRITSGVSGTSGTTYFVGANYASGVRDYETDNSFVINGNAINPTIYVNSGQTLQNVVFKPMIRLATESDATFAPYSNICPISGYTECNVVRAGVNQWDEEWEVGAIGSDGQLVDSTTVIRSKNYIKVTPSTTYYCKSTSIVYIHAYDVNHNWISMIYNGGYNSTFTTPANCEYIKFRLTGDYGTTYNHDISINYPSTITSYQPYQPYQGQAVTLTFDNTVYSGTVDWCNGVVTVDKGMVDLGDLTWSKNSDGVFVATGLQASATSSLGEVANLLCSQYVASTWGNVLNKVKDGTIALSTTYGIIYDSRYTDAIAFKNALDGVQLLYELATPQTYNLTPTQVKMLKGYNTVTTDANGGMVIRYQPDNVIGEIKAYASRLYDDILDRLEALSQ